MSCRKVFTNIFALLIIIGIGRDISIAKPLLTLPSSPITVKVEAINNTSISGELGGSFQFDNGRMGLELKTPSGLTRLALNQIRSIKFKPLAQLTVVSSPQTQCFSLGNVSINLPEPPDWYGSLGASRHWRPATLAHPNYNWFYIPGASWIWSPGSSSGLDARGEVVLFRQVFEIPATFQVVEGQLFLTVDDYINGLYLNGISLSHPETSLIGGLSQYDVTNVLEPGENILAIKAINGVSTALNFAGLSFKLDILGYSVGSTRVDEKTEKSTPGVVVFTINEDRLSGDLADISSHMTAISSEAGRIAVDNDWIDTMLLNYEAAATSRAEAPDQARGKKEHGLANTTVRLFSSGARKFTRTVKVTVAGKDISGLSKGTNFYWQVPDAALRATSIEPERWQQPGRTGEPGQSRFIATGVGMAGAQLRDQGFVPGRLIGLDGQNIQVKPPFGSPVTLPPWQISRIFPNPEPKAEQDRKYVHFRPDSIEQIVQVKLTNGDTITGLLEELGPTSLVVSPLYGTETKLDNNFIASCHFPYSLQSYLVTRSAGKAALGGNVALIGDIESSSDATNVGHSADMSDQSLSKPTVVGGSIPAAGRPLTDTSYYKVVKSLSEMGIDHKWLNALEMIKPDLLNPASYPILINIDERERYYHSVMKPDDGFDALVNYVKSGGTLIHLGKGAPFYFGLVASHQNWVVGTRGTELNRLLGLRIIVPGDSHPEGKYFEVPDNSTRTLYFELKKEAPLADFLPARLEFPLVKDTRFRPVVPAMLPEEATSTGEQGTKSQFYPVYILKDDNNNQYGVAMAIVKYGPGHYCSYVSQLLVNSEYDDVPMINYLMPVFIHLANESDKQ